MLEHAEKLIQLSRHKHQDFLREAAEQRRAVQAGGWGLRWHTAQFLLRVAVRLSPAHRALLTPQRPLAKRVTHG